MVGSPFQTSADLARDLKFIEEFCPEMCGIGPFIPHKDTDFKNEPAGTVDQWARFYVPNTDFDITVDREGRVLPWPKREA